MDDRGAPVAPRGALIQVAWELTADDRLAAVEHADRRFRPLRAVAAAGIAGAVEVLALPRPLTPWMWTLIGAGALLVGLAAWQLARVRGVRAPPAGARRFALSVERGLVVRREDVTVDLAPSGVRRLTVGADHLFLHLADGDVITVPCRILDAPRAVDVLVLAIEAHRRRGRAPTEEVPSDRAVWQLTFTAPRRIGELRPLVRGEVFAALGPAGGWVRGAHGIVSFPWEAVRRIEDHPDGPRITVGDRALCLPRGAFAARDDQDRALFDLQRWWSDAHPARVPPAANRPPADRENPYAAPR